LFHEGIYALTFKGYPGANGSPASDTDSGEALAILRNGTVLGSDRFGGLFTGTYAFDPGTGQNMFRVSIDVPPQGELITGFTAGYKGATFDIVAAFDTSLSKAATTIHVAGQPVDVKFTFLGVLPK
jgi:hypothetical protein